MDGMNQSGIYNHLQQIHKVNRQFEPLPVEEDNLDKENRSVVTTVEVVEETKTNKTKTAAVPDPKIELVFAQSCDQCNLGFIHKNNLLKHKKKDHGSQNSIKPDVISNKESEQNNKHKHFNFSEINTCENCGAIFSSKYMLKGHEEDCHTETAEVEINSNKQSNQFHCALQEETACQFQCNTKEEVDSHVEEIHRSFPKIQCTDCSLNFKNIEDLSRHTNIFLQHATNVEKSYTTKKKCQFT